jgi:excisionase family DNA binding protein
VTVADDLVDVPADTTAVVTVPALLSVATVARILDCSPRTARRRIADGELAAYSDHGRVVIRGDDLRAYVDRLERLGDAPSRRRSAAPRNYDFLRE